MIEGLENPYFDGTLQWYKDRLKQLQKRATEARATKLYEIQLEEKPKPQTKIVRKVIKHKKAARPGIMKEEKKEAGPPKNMTSIQQLIVMMMYSF